MQRHDAHQAPRALDDQAVMSSASIRPGLPGLSQLANRTIRLPLSDEGIDLGAMAVTVIMDLSTPLLGGRAWP